MEPKASSPSILPKIKFVNPPEQKPLEFLRDKEALLRRQTVEMLVPILPPSVASSLEKTSAVAEASLSELADIDLEQISDIELRRARILIGLSFIGFGALCIVLLLLYLNTLDPELSPVEQIRKYWYQYIWFVNLGVTGMFMLGREVMRSHHVQ